MTLILPAHTSQVSSPPGDRTKDRVYLRGSDCPLGDPQPVAVWVAEFELAPIGRLPRGAAELGHDGVYVPDEQPDQRVRPCVASMFGQVQPCPAARSRRTRGSPGRSGTPTLC